MNTNPTPRCTSQELTNQINERIEELAKATDAARMGEEMLHFLDTFSRFHRYSICNTWLILMACPQATRIAGFRSWHKFNRFVRKGQHGIAILAPILKTNKEDPEIERKVLCGFKVVYVFDLSQTEGEPLPEPPDWKSPEKNMLLSERLIAFAQARGISVIEKILEGEIQGVSKGGSIELAPEAGTATLVHEIAHELLHKRSDLSLERSVRELEAEAVAYVVSRHFGLDGSTSPNYIALHGATSEMIMEHLERVRGAAEEIIQFVEAQNETSTQATDMVNPSSLEVR